MDIPTKDQLNHLSCTQVNLIILRCLMTSDLTYMHDLYDGSTIRDIITTAKSLKELDGKDHHLTPEEEQDFDDYIKQLQEYIDS